MEINPQDVWADFQAIKINSPLIHNITNYVVMEHTANCLLAIGASPVMAHASEEVEEMTGLASSLVLNIGTLSPHWVQSMQLALKAAHTKGIPVVFDPVGVGATSYRAQSAHSILNHSPVSAIRGNASEVVSLHAIQACDERVEATAESKGVDSLLDSSHHTESAKNLAIKRKCIVWMSGKTDIITDGRMIYLIDNGDPLMCKVTGMGCAATAITGAFLAINPDFLKSCVHAAIVFGIAGEIAAEENYGPGSFKLAFIDALHSLSFDHIQKRMCVRAL